MLFEPWGHCENIVDMLKDQQIQIVFNTTEGMQSLEDSRSIRSISIRNKIPYYTTAAGCNAAAKAIREKKNSVFTVYKIQDIAKQSPLND